jgi:hypothetical protein
MGYLNKKSYPLFKLSKLYQMNLLLKINLVLIIMNLQREALANIYVIPRSFDTLCKQEQQNKTKILKTFASKEYIETSSRKRGDKITKVNTILKKINGKPSEYIKFNFEEMPF